MLKKILLLSLVLFGLLFFQMPKECFADASAQFELAKTYGKQGNYEQAEQVYKAIVTDYPGTDDAFQAQKKLPILYIIWHKGLQAEAAFQELVTKFSENERIANAVYDLAVRCNRRRKYRWAIKFY
ncbi:MAG TPA: tetratricopeptide repeat protein, partial [candidate division Zixibacteria bacterium]|nr:tetratricopeptide repeat protein [candidate division Zixibacteria bacterium]